MTLASRLLESALEGALRKASQRRRRPRPEARPDEGHDEGSVDEVHDRGPVDEGQDHGHDQSSFDEVQDRGSFDEAHDQGSLDEAHDRGSLDQAHDEGSLDAHEDDGGDGHFEEELDGGESGAVDESDSRRNQDWFFGPRPDEDPQTASDGHEYDVDEDEISEESSDRRRVTGRALVAGAAILALLAVTVVLVRAAVIRPDPATVQASPTQTRTAVPPAPAGAPEEGSFSESRVTKNGEVRVQQWVRSSAPMFGLRLATPPGLAGPGPAKVTDLFVASNQSVLNQPTTLGPLGHRLFFDAPPVLVYVRYTIRGAVDRSPSVPGRALARATALDVLRSPETGPSQVTVVGDGIRSVACAAPGTVVLTPCGTEGKGRWTVLLRGVAREAAVVAQVDLS